MRPQLFIVKGNSLNGRGLLVTATDEMSAKKKIKRYFKNDCDCVLFDFSNYKYYRGSFLMTIADEGIADVYIQKNGSLWEKNSVRDFTYIVNDKVYSIVDVVCNPDFKFLNDTIYKNAVIKAEDVYDSKEEIPIQMLVKETEDYDNVFDDRNYDWI